MIENLRGRSAETKYGRIPLWLYETGAGLQAIATYGWLHGRYGHYERVMPSYATLAKELGVSRGSVIAYVKELVRVGAVRIETSGATGQQTNLYVIAFNEPFPAAEEPAGGGQNADHPVSGLYRGGQNADRGGQRAVHEEDVPKKTKKTHPPSPPPTPAPPQALPVTEGRVGGRDAAPTTSLTHEEQQAYDALARITHTTPQLPVGEHELQRLAPLAAPWLERTTEARMRDALTAGLPAQVGSPFGLLRDRLLKKLPPAAPAPAATHTGTTNSLPPWCGQCGDGMPAEFNARFRTRDGAACPQCHPATVAA